MKGRQFWLLVPGRGLGASFCHIVAEAGAQVLALGRQEAALTHLITSLPGAGHDIVIADVTDPAAVSAGLAGKSYNGVINNAGIATTAPLHNSAVDDARHVINTNLLGNLWVLQASVPALVAAGGGVIVNIASVLGHRPFAANWHLRGQQGGGDPDDPISGTGTCARQYQGKCACPGLYHDRP